MNESLFKVLVADDEYWIRENLRGIIDWREHSFVFLEPAEDGEQALEIIRQEKPDIVITDVNMPFLSGTELIRAAAAETPETAFIALSGYSDYDYVRTALTSGAVDYLLKPISKSDLLSVLSKAVDRVLSNEKLRIASSSALDRELSGLLHRSTDPKQLQASLMEYELDFASFTLVMFRTAGLSSASRGRDSAGFDKYIFYVKEKISSHVASGKNLIFNYTYKSNEFLLVSDMEASSLASACDKISASLKEMTETSVTTIIGRHYFSFSSLRDAYNETLVALFAIDYSKLGTIVYVSATQDCAAKKRMSPEQEKGLHLAVASDNRELFKNILYGEIRLQDCAKNGWRFVETRQTADSIAWILRGEKSGNTTSAQLLALDNLAESLDYAVDNFNVKEMLGILEQMLDEVFEPEGQPRQNESMRQTVAQIKQYIEENYFEDLSLNMLSQQFLVESSYLSKVFKQEAGDNLMLYIAKKRVERAKEYLPQDNLSITEISRLVGYGDYAYFSRVFRKITGESPREYKERVTANNA